MIKIIKQLENKFGEFHYEINNNKVTRLDLNSRYVENEDLELIGELTNLQELNLHHNNITTIQSLNNLIYVRLKKQSL